MEQKSLLITVCTRLLMEICLSHHILRIIRKPQVGSIKPCKVSILIQH
eukprot:UN01331